MVFIRSLGFLEIIFISLFVLGTFLYFVRHFRVARMFSSRAEKIIFKFLLRLVYFILLIIALLGPSLGEFKKEVKNIGKDIYLLVDLSRSMDALDISPSRLEKIKFELRKVLSDFHSDRIGLIIFSTEAFLQCPLTHDHTALLLFIETLSSNIILNTGTDFAPALKMALQKHEKEKNHTKEQKSKIIILISDGEDFGKETIEIAEKIKAKGIKLFTLGVGTTEGSKIPYRGRFKTDKEGKEIISILNSKALKKLSQITEGKYFEISDKTNDIKRMINALDQIEGELRSTKKIDVKANKYYYFLYAAIILIVLDILFTIRAIEI